MNVADLLILETVRDVLAAVPGVRTARVVRAGERVEFPLSRLVAATVEPAGAEDLQWPDVPAGRYHLLHWQAAVLDRAPAGTRALESLVGVAEACRAAIAAATLLGGRAEDGPPSLRHPDLAPAAGATRTAPLRLADAAPGQPTALLLQGASGYWVEPMAGSAAIDDEVLFSSGPHVVAPGSPARRVQDQAFNGLAGGLAIDLGDAPREIVQPGVLSADTPAGLVLLLAAAEAFVDGRTYTLTAPDGTDYRHCRVERLDRRGPPVVGTRWHQPYRITYRQLVR